MMGALDVRQAQAQDLMNTVRSDHFKSQIAVALPGNVSPDRFIRALVTAAMQNPDLTQPKLRETLITSVLKCAQDGLLPDGREAALVVFGTKVAYMPMIGGFRKIAAEHGWTLRARAVFSNDDFDYSEEPPELTHRPARVGTDRGELLAAYAIAVHRDGRRLQRVMHADDVEKRRRVARSQNVWNEWPTAMWEKTAGRDLFAELPLDEADRDRARRVIDASEFAPGESEAVLYGSPPSPAGLGPGAASGDEEGQQAGEGSPPVPTPAPGPTDEPDPAEADPGPEEPFTVDEAGQASFAELAEKAQANRHAKGES